MANLPKCSKESLCFFGYVRIFPLSNPQANFNHLIHSIDDLEAKVQQNEFSLNERSIIEKQLETFKGEIAIMQDSIQSIFKAIKMKGM